MTPRQTVVSALLPLASLLTTTTTASGANEEDKNPSVITVHGEASVSRAPDEARIEIGVQTEDESSERAADRNAEKVETVLRALKKVAGREAKIRTLGYTLQPRYRYREKAGREIVGYTASNTVEVETTDLTRVGKLIEAATSGGANEVRGLHFGLADDLSARAAALAEATRRAQRKAEAIAGALGVELGRVLDANEGGAQVSPRHRQVYAEAAMARSSQEAPVEPGTIDVRATMTLQFAIER